MQRSCPPAPETENAWDQSLGWVACTGALCTNSAAFLAHKSALHARTSDLTGV